MLLPVLPHRCRLRAAACVPLICRALPSARALPDVYAEFTDASGARRTHVLKLLSEDPANYPDAPREGIRRVLEAATGVQHPRGVPLDTSRIAAIRMGTTVGLGWHPCVLRWIGACSGTCRWRWAPGSSAPAGQVVPRRYGPAALAPLLPCSTAALRRGPRRWPRMRCWSGRASARHWW